MMNFTNKCLTNQTLFYWTIDDYDDLFEHNFQH